MYKLSIKFSILLIPVLLVFGAAAALLPQQPIVAGGYSVHWSVLLLGWLGLLFIVSMMMFDKAKMLQKYKVFLTMVAASSLYGIISNVISYPWKLQVGGIVDFSYAEVGIMTLGGILTAFFLYKLEPFDSFAAGGLERLQKSKAHADDDNIVQPPTPDSKWDSAASAEDLMPKPKGGASANASSNKLRGMSVSKTDIQASTPAPAAPPREPTSVESAQALMTPSVEIDLDAADEMLSAPLNPSPNAAPARPSPSAPKAAPGAPAGPGGDKGGASSSRLQAQRRRNTSTFTKLQALSASGTGTVRPTPAGGDSGGGGGGDLRSLLDRLDAEPSEEAETIPSPEEIRVEILFTEFEATKKPEPARPMASAPTATPPKPTPAVRELAQPARPTPATTGGATPNPRNSLSNLAAKGPPKPPAPADNTPRLASLLDRAEALAGDEEEEAAPAAPVKAPEPVAKEPPARPPEPVAKKEEPKNEPETGGLLSKRFMELSDDDGEEEEAPPAVRSYSPSDDEDEEREGPVFAESVDGDIDDIFSGLAPAEAQREVGEEKEVEAEAEEQEEAPQARAAEEEADESGRYEEVSVTDGEDGNENIFSESVDGDIDDIFSNLAPAEAQRTVDDYKEEIAEEEEEEEEEPEPEPEPVREDNLEMTGELDLPKIDEEETEEESPAARSGDDEEEEEAPLFQLGDSDVDDIFSGITEGKQDEVNPDTLKKIKEEREHGVPSSGVETGDNIPAVKPELVTKSAKQTGDMPSMTKEQADKISAKAKSQDDDEDEDESVEVGAAEAPPDSPEAAKLKKELKEFGKLSGKSAAAPKATGEAVGTMKTIGKLLIDTQAVENIIKAGEQRKLGQGMSTARVISSQRGQGITELLNKIDTYEGVVGSLIVGHDGLVMASTLKQGWDKDMLGALSTALLSTSNLTTKKLEIGKLRQMVMLTKLNNVEKTTVLTDVDVGILAVFVEETEVEKIDGLLETIHKTIHG